MAPIQSALSVDEANLDQPPKALEGPNLSLLREHLKALPHQAVN
jgi:hypothetical protein